MNSGMTTRRRTPHEQILDRKRREDMKGIRKHEDTCLKNRSKRKKERKSNNR